MQLVPGTEQWAVAQVRQIAEPTSPRWLRDAVGRGIALLVVTPNLKGRPANDAMGFVAKAFLLGLVAEGTRWEPDDAEAVLRTFKYFARGQTWPNSGMFLSALPELTAERRKREAGEAHQRARREADVRKMIAAAAELPGLETLPEFRPPPAGPELRRARIRAIQERLVAHGADVSRVQRPERKAFPPDGEMLMALSRPAPPLPQASDEFGRVQWLRTVTGGKLFANKAEWEAWRLVGRRAMEDAQAVPEGG